MFIEVVLGKFEDELKVHTIRDKRLRPESIANILVKNIHPDGKNTWTPLDYWSQTQALHLTVPTIKVEILNGILLLVDPRSDLLGETIGIVILYP